MMRFMKGGWNFWQVRGLVEVISLVRLYYLLAVTSIYYLEDYSLGGGTLPMEVTVNVSEK